MTAAQDYEAVREGLIAAAGKETRGPALEVLAEIEGLGHDGDAARTMLANLIAEHKLFLDDEHNLSVPQPFVPEEFSTKEPIAIRKQYYNSVLDPSQTGPDVVATRKRIARGEYSADVMNQSPSDAHPANLVSSLCTDGKHRPALDIDIPCELIPSSTNGHYHLYFPTLDLSWETYRLLLDVLAYVGIIEDGFRGAAAANKETLLRMPHVKKISTSVPNGVAPRKDYSYPKSRYV